MPTMIVRWSSIMDKRTCPICRMLHGYEWRFPVRAGGFPPVLELWYGAAKSKRHVWDMAADHSLVHPPMSGDCRCRLEYVFDADDIQHDVDILKKQVEAIYTAVKP